MPNEEILERVSRKSLDDIALREIKRRPAVLATARKLIATGELLGDYPEEFFAQLKKMYSDWTLDIADGGFRFAIDFPYEHEFYGMGGWDKSRIAVNVNAAERMVAYRAYLDDEQAGMVIKEGILIRGDEVKLFSDIKVANFMYRPHLAALQSQFEQTKGASGLLFDQAKPQLGLLPDYVRELSGHVYESFGTAVYHALVEGRVDPQRSRRLNLQFPLLDLFTQS